MMPRLSRKRLCIENPPMPIKKKQNRLWIFKKL